MGLSVLYTSPKGVAEGVAGVAEPNFRVRVGLGLVLGLGLGLGSGLGSENPHSNPKIVKK